MLVSFLSRDFLRKMSVVFVVLIFLSRNLPTEGASAGCSINTTYLVATNQTQGLQTPHYPYPYPANALCTWLVTAPQDQVVVLYFKRFALKNSFGCQDDYFLIRDGPNSASPLLYRLCGKLKNCPVSSTGRYMWMQFVSHKTSTFNGGIYVTYAALSKGSTLGNLGPVTVWQRNTLHYSFTAKGIFSEVPLPTCLWKISAPPGRLISFSIKSKSIMVYLDVCDGPNPTSPRITQLDGYISSSADVTSSGNHVLIRIVHEKSTVGLKVSGISLQVFNFKEHSRQINGCSSAKPLNVISDGSITSPFHPQYYPNNQQCLWRIKAPANYRIRFRFQSFYLIQPGDYVEVRDGYSSNAALIGNFTRSSSVKFWTSSGRFLWICFKSDRENTAAGFALRIYFLLSFIPVPHTVQPTSTLVQLISTVQQVQPTSSTLFPLISTSAVIQGQSNFSGKDNKTLVVPSSSTNRPPTNISIIVGLAMGSCFLAVIALILVWLVIKKRKEIRARKQIISYTAEPWEIRPEQVTLKSELGHGAFGKVWQGEIDVGLIQELKTRVKSAEERSISNNEARVTEEKEETVTVAVKVLHDDATSDECSEFLREIELMKTVGFHRNIISMLACCTKEKQVFLVVEYAMHGDLLNVLRKRRLESSFLNTSKAEPMYENTEQLQKVENLMKDFLSFSWQIARGMEYLGSKGLVHRDLAARNVLVAQDDLLKVADFGLSRHVTYEGGAYRANGPRKLPIKWMSPEAIFDQTFTTKSDVWSYGIVLWEIYTMGGSPYPTFSNRQLVNELRSGYRMEKPNLCDDDMYKIMIACWQENPDDRPSFTKIKQDIEEFMTQDNPYLEIQGIDHNNDCYLVPSFDSAAETEVVI